MSDERERSVALIERLLSDPGLRARFRDDPDGVLSAHGLGALSPGQRALLTLELRESRSSLAGATLAAAADGIAGAEAAAHAAPGWAHAVAQEISHLVHGGANPHSPAAHEPLAPADVPPLATSHSASAAREPAPSGVAPPTGAPAPRPAQHPAPGTVARTAPTEARTDARTSAAAAHAVAGAAHAHADAAQSHADALALADHLAYPGDGASPRALAAWMGTHAARAGLPPELPVMAALTESGLRNLPYGDRDSVGFFQMRTSVWDRGAYAGYPHEPALQLRWFIDRALAVGLTRPELARSPSSWGEWIADVEQPAAPYRGRYQEQLDAAQALLTGVDVHPGAVRTPGEAALRVAERFLGTPYDWGGASPRTGFDCSGLVQFAFAQVGIHLPRVAADQFAAGVPVARSDLQPGDAVFFAAPGGEVHHVGIYIGDGRFIDAPQTGEDVRIDSLGEPYFAAQYAGARRFGGAETAARGYARTLPALGS